MTNAEYAASDGTFIFACKLANVEPTKRQASKFRRDEGLAYKALRFIEMNKHLHAESEEVAQEALVAAGLRRLA